MAKGFGLYYSDNKLKWVVSELVNDTLVVETAGEYKPGDNEHPLSFPADLPEDVALVLTPDHSYFYNLSFPFKSRNKIYSVLKSDIEERCLDPVDTVVADFYTLKQTEDGSEGVCVTLPKEHISTVIDMDPDIIRPSLISLDIFVLVSVIARLKIRTDRYFLISFTEKTAFLAEVENGLVQKVRGIPVTIESGEQARDAIGELVKRFDIPEPEENILIYSGIDRIDTIFHTYDGISYEVLNVKMALAETDGNYNLLIPAAAAAVAANPGNLPDFRKEEFAGSGVFNLLVGHSAILLGAVGVLLLVLIFMVSYLKGGYEQQVKSLNARIEREADLVLDKKELKDAMKTPGTTLEQGVSKIFKKYKAQVKGGADNAEIPESAFKMLNEILSHFPEDLDIKWDRIAVNQRNASFRGTCDDTTANTAKFDTFVKRVQATGAYELSSKSTTGGSIRVTFKNIKDE